MDTLKHDQLKRTLEAASAFADDIDHLRQVVKDTDHRSGTIRRMSGPLRRLLVDRDINKVAAPRIGRFQILAPNFNYLYRMERRVRLKAVIGGEVKISGYHLGPMTLLLTNASEVIEPGQTAPSFESYMKHVYPEGFPEHPETQLMRLDPFLSQRVLYLEGVWINRRTLIKYMANTASGVHSDTPTTPEEIALARLRHGFAVKHTATGFDLELPEEPHQGIGKLEFKHRSDGLDPAFIQLLETASCLVSSPDVLNLESIIRSELEAG